METLKDMIRRHEGLSLTAYRCPAGKETIGYGWNLEAHALPPEIASRLRVTGSITPAMADELLDISIGVATADCRSIYIGFDGFAEARKAALVDFMLNVGAGTAMKFKRMHLAIEAGNWNEAAEQVRDSEYWRQLGGDPKGTDDGKLERPEEIAAMLRKG